jgi:putative Mn2+ efflux pump MntP
MSIFTILTLSVGLAMDAFAVAICKGLAMKKMSIKKALIIGGYFGFFQGAMPLIGYFLGITFKKSISACDHWIAFGLLSLIGISMIREALNKEEENVNDSVAFKTMIILALATSIDALAVGVTFAIVDAPIIQACSLIAIITFVLSMIGVKIGHVFGIRFKSKAEFAGGIVLIILGFKILFEHLGIFA